MRSRYAAFAAGLVDYLIDTLHPEHEDAKLDRAVVAASFRSTVEGFKFTGLRIVEADETFVDGPTVTFVARLFTRGVDHSFAERSLFGWVDGRVLYKKGLWTRDAKGGVYESAPGDAEPTP